MAVFALVPLGNNFDKLTTMVTERVAEPDRYELANHAGWLVSHKGTTTEVSNFLDITGQPEGQKSPVGATLIVPVTSYYGRGHPDMWEWLKDRLEVGT